jgi:hypothetical protein
LSGAGFSDVRVNVGARLTGDPFTVLVASGSVPALDSHVGRGVEYQDRSYAPASAR